MLICVSLSNFVRAAPVPNTEYAKSTLVVYNQNIPESRQLAAFYAKARDIPIEHLVALNCALEETISRTAYNDTIANPLRGFMTENQLWELETASQGKIAKSCKIHIIALMKGVPLRIQMEPLPPTGKVDAEGKPVTPVKNKQQTDEASVDSELTMLSLDAAPTRSMGRNPFFKSDRTKSAAGIAAMMLVGRIDGPDFATAQRLIEDALAVEKGGLWGNAYIDLSRMGVTKGAGYKIGDEWLTNIAKSYAQMGIPTYVDRHPERIATNFPLGDDVIFYFGWYARNADGPFANPEFKFKRGAVATHIHSYSATTLRHQTYYWVGPLLLRGAAAVMGNVYEPFLTMTTHLDLFNARLLEGYTFIESGWMATPNVSWMNVMVGDPLYQPFLSGRPYGKTPDPDFKAVRMGVNRWRDDGPELYAKLAFAADKLRSAKIYETIGLRYREELKFDEAAAAFKKAGGMFQQKDDKLRMELFVIELLRSQQNKKEAVAELRRILPGYQGMPGTKTIEALINQLDPPPPPPPPAVEK
ncbi:MAG: hypothetical protein ACI8XO_003219 [Verrucomicrobiales bacterium]|jgi:uncharacterized protein (TIGR03790 family)